MAQSAASANNDNFTAAAEYSDPNLFHIAVPVHFRTKKAEAA